MSIFTGSGVAIVTPMYADGTINFDKLGELIDFQIKEGTDSIIICGTTGESSTMTHDEHLECIRYAVDKVAKRVPVVAGTGSNCTREAVDLSKKAQQVGADGLLCVTPYYNKATQAGLAQYYIDIAKSVDLPIIMYSVASRTGCNITPEVALKAFKGADNIVAIKEASGNISQVAKIASITEGELDIYSGNDDMIVPMMSIGSKGVISVLANVAPKQTHDMTAACFAGDYQTAAKMQLDALELINALFCEVNPIPVKAALNMMGMEVGSLRAPLTEMEDKNKEVLLRAMKNYGLVK
ncbi:MAG: 4-hydroxy-tetrahydrodipicolinate synthase [Lachnospiraceae bacterium]|nr:4-hydroxy-tetrahydrodipicolinate synthase [Lachnospiraceae bacterium]